MKKGLALTVLPSLLVGLLSAQTPSLTVDSFSTGSPASTLLTLAAPGRVSLRAVSPLGVGISLVDRMEGELARSGSTATADGRLDISLDAGQYRVVLDDVKAAGGTARLEARSFAPSNGSVPAEWPRLLDGVAATGTLRDLESASYWVELRKDGPLEIEAMGRDLNSIQVWRDGSYLLGSWSPTEDRQVETGRPMGWLSASTMAKAGHYLVRLYGGEARKWANENGSHPLYVRSGFLRLPAGGRLELSLSVFGRDFVLAQGIDSVTATRQTKGALVLAGGDYRVGQDRLSSDTRSTLDGKGPELSLGLALPSSGESLLRVEAKPGEAISLDACRARGGPSISSEESSHGGILSLIVPRTGQPFLDPTGIVYRVPKGATKPEILFDFAAPLSSSSSFRGRVARLSSERLEVYLRADEAGTYRVAEKAGMGQAAGLYQVYPLDLYLQAGSPYLQPAPASNASFMLTKGYYLLTIDARSLGTLDFALYRERLGGGGAELAGEPAPRNSRNWRLAPGWAEGIGALVGDTGIPGTGFSFSSFPISLEAGLALDLGAGETLAFSALQSTPGRLRLNQGGPVLLSGGKAVIDGSAGPVDGTLAASGGAAQGGLAARDYLAKNGGASPLPLRISFEPTYDDLPPPAVGSFGTGATIVTPGLPAWRDYGREDRASYAFEVREAGVWVIETLGRLSTSLSLRTATRSHLLDASGNGPGRNSAIRAWLRPGQYYLEVSTRDQSMGRGGLRVDRVPLEAALNLSEGAVDRRDLAADSVLRYSLGIDRPGNFELNSVGLGSSFPVRIEDAEAFPVYVGAGRARGTMAKGTYTLYSLPLSLETKRLTWFRRLPPESPPFTGSGTRRIEFNRDYSALWKDGSIGDRYSFSVPGDLEAGIDMPANFAGELRGPGPTIALSSDNAGRLSLTKGDWLLTLKPKDKNNLLSYKLALRTSTLAPGIPSTYLPSGSQEPIEVSIPEDGWYELWSLGQADVHAALLPAGSTTPLASSDDRGPDWNFSIGRYLKAGAYELDIGAFQPSQNPVQIFLDQRRPKTLDRASSSFEADLDPGPDGVILPFDTKGDEGLYVVEASSALPLSLGVYKGGSALAESESLVAIPLRGNSSYELHLSSPLPGKVHLSVRKVATADLSLSRPGDLGQGSAWRLLNPDAISARLVSGRLLVSPGFEEPCLSPGTDAFSTGAEGGFAYLPEGGQARPKVESLDLADGEGAVLPLSAVDQGFFASSPDRAILVSASTRGLFQCGLSVAPADSPGGIPYQWADSVSWAQGRLALLPPGRWKARAWSGDRDASTRRLGVGIDSFPLSTLPALALGARSSIPLPSGRAYSIDIPASRVSALLGEGVVLAAWKGNETLAVRSGFDGRAAATLDLPACRLLVLNGGKDASTLRLALLPPVGVAVGPTLDAADPWESLGLPSEGVELAVKAAPGELLCVAGDSVRAELEADDGRLISIVKQSDEGLFASLPAANGRLHLRASKGLARLWLAKPGRELEGLLAQGQGAAKDLVDASLLSGRGDAFRLVQAQPGYVDISCPGPALLALQGPGMEPKVVFSGSREDAHLFAWIGAGEYRLWQRPIQGQVGGGVLRLDRVDSQDLDPAAPPRAFIAANEYQAWKFQVTAKGKVGIGLEADRDGLEGFLYDEKQKLLDRGSLIFDELEAGDYLLLVKGLPDSPMEYSVVLAGTQGSRQGTPPDVIDSYKRGDAPPASVGLPLSSPGGLHVWGGQGAAATSASASAGGEESAGSDNQGEDSQGDLPADSPDEGGDGEGE